MSKIRYHPAVTVVTLLGVAFFLLFASLPALAAPTMSPSNPMHQRLHQPLVAHNQAKINSNNQMQMTVHLLNKICKAGMVKIFKAENGSAACVTPASYQRLIAIGWGIEVAKEMAKIKAENSTTTQNMSAPVSNVIQTATTTQSNSSQFSIMTNVYGSDIASQIAAIQPYLRSQDIVDITSDQISYASQLKSLGVQVAVGGQTSLNAQGIKDTVLVLPLDNTDIVSYDYETGTKPDFSTDQSVALSHFSDLYQAVHAKGKKLWINPAWGAKISNWDWGLIAQNTDILDVQIQHFETGSKNFGRGTMGMTLHDIVSQITQQVKSKSPSTKLYFQFGGATGQTPQQAVDDINSIRDIPFDGVMLFWSVKNPSFVPQVMQGLGR